ncbi:MAG: hypothetical protein ACFFAO_04425 [Candidatus Hermodarchaeota archaeon]
MTSKETPDYSELTCTNLMIKLKILLKKLTHGDAIRFFSNREQYDNIKKPFSKNPYEFEAQKVDHNKYFIEILKN